ncbi:MAG: ParA family protein [Halolamina sp.]
MTATTTTTATTTALVGAAGGVGTTRTALELGATAARDGEDVVVLDAAYGTQGLADHVEGRLTPDLTALVTDRRDDALAAGLVELGADLAGELTVAPARAPFERLARAKAPEAARTLEARIAEASERADLVLVDTPPVAANQAVAVVTSVDRVVAVTRPTERGGDAVQRLRGRLQDAGASLDATLAVGTDAPESVSPDAVVPEREAPPSDVPVAATDREFAVAVAPAAETAGATVDLEPESDGLLDGTFVDLG